MRSKKTILTVSAAALGLAGISIPETVTRVACSSTRKPGLPMAAPSTLQPLTRQRESSRLPWPKTFWPPRALAHGLTAAAQLPAKS